MSTIKANTLLHSDGSTTTQPSIPALDQRMASAWVNFNGTGTVAIRDSYNVSSITDITTGQYLVNFTTSTSNSNYSCALGSNASVTNQGGFNRILTFNRYYVQIRHYENGQQVDTDIMSAIVFAN